MLKAALIVSQHGQATQEVESGESMIHIGAALDNTVCLEPDPGIERYHAVIERRGDATYWLRNLSTRQGTKVNEQVVLGERRLKDGDRIMLGGSCLIEFYRSEASTPPAGIYGASPASGSSSVGSELNYAASSATGAAASVPSSNISSAAPVRVASSDTASGSTPPEMTTNGLSSGVKVIAASAVVAAVVVTVAAVVLFKPFGGGGCQPSARIMTPLNGAALRSATTVRVETDETQCIRRISYELDGKEVAASSAAPFDVTLDPKRLTTFAAGNHVLTATVQTTDGNATRQPGEVYVALGGNAGRQSGAAAQPAPTPDDVAPESARSTQVTAADVQAMTERLASQISGKSGYVFEREMTARIHALTNEYASTRVAERAARHRRVVVKAFSDRDVRPLLGFVLAMSRSKFDEASGTEGSGIWRVPPGVARSYSLAGEATAVSVGQQSSAEVAAVYLKDLLGVFEAENFDLAVACYGCTLEEAGALKQRLANVPASERRNFWRLFERGLIGAEQAERVIRFYAAGIVGENPQRFGAADDRSLSSLEY